MKRKTTPKKIWLMIPEAAETLNIPKWLRRSIVTGILSLRHLPFIGQDFLNAVKALPEEKQRNFEFALRNWEGRYTAAGDAFGVVGIPIFIGLFTFFNITEATIEILYVYAGVMVAYFLLFCYYRYMSAILRQCTKVLEMERREPTYCAE